MADGIVWDDEAEPTQEIAWDEPAKPREAQRPDDLNSFEVKPKDTSGLFSDVPDIARSGVQGAAMGFADEGEAAIRSALPGSKSYSEERDALRPKYDKAVRDYPVMNVAGAFAVPIPGTGKLTGAAKLAGMVGQGIGIGGLNALGNSTADLTEGEYGDAGKDTLTGASIGGAVSGALGLGGGLASKFPKLAEFLRGKSTAAIQDAESQATKAVEKGIASAKGAYGSGVQSGSRDLEVMLREAEQLPPGQLKEALSSFLSGGEGLALREKVASSKLQSAPGRIGEMQSLLADYQAKEASKAGDIASKTTDALSLGKQVWPRLKTLGHRALPVGLATAGGLIGGTEGAMVGGALGGGMALLQGRPGVVINNMVRSPAFRKAGYGALAKGAEALAAPVNWAQKLPELLQSAPERLGRYGPALLLELNKHGREGLVAMDHALAQEDPEYREARAQAGGP